MITRLGCTAALAILLAVGAGADDKIDAKKLVGKWEPKSEEKKESKMVIEFVKDGKLTVTADKDFKIDGKWKLDGNKLTLEMKVGENEIKDTVTITKLTDDELIGESDSKKQKQTFLRVK
jgi:uncharacterized protein (TIGR03066 family)